MARFLLSPPPTVPASCALDLVAFNVVTQPSAEGVDPLSDRVLLVQERRGHWFLPAGHVDRPSEPFEVGAARECVEEAGLQVQVSHVSELVYSLLLPRTGYSPLHVVFVSQVVGGSLKTTADHESLCAEWVPLGAVMSSLALAIETEGYHGPTHPMGEEWAAGGTLRSTAVPVQDGRRWRKAWEIGPILARYLRCRQRNALAPVLR
mmetsp:Transcript_60557/g.131421  ORF Transcript_60557/g.131421 Transcript_60557/m.131421 type:complete len:206 (+) Transcript_60557:117-734(+)